MRRRINRSRRRTTIPNRTIITKPFLISICRTARLGPLDLPKDSSSHPNQPNDARNYAIRNLAATRVVRDLQAQTAIDDAESDQHAAEPQMRVRPDLAALVLLVHGVVDEAEDWLEEEKAEDYDSDDWVVA
jgi:hypothetical protein